MSERPIPITDPLDEFDDIDIAMPTLQPRARGLTSEQAVHDAEIRLSGDADARAHESGVLCGVKLERYAEGGWRVERMV